jgi:hypothetical protein
MSRPSFFYQRDADAHARVFEPDNAPTCADCHDLIVRGGCSVPVDGGRWYCDPCYRWRSARQLLFDPRRRSELDTEVA